LGGAAAAVFVGAGAALDAANIAASIAVGAVAGAAGSVTGDAVTAGIAHERFSAERAGLDALTGVVGGIVGAGVGGLAARGAMSVAEQFGVNAVKWAGSAAATLAGGGSAFLAAGGVASAVTRQSMFSGRALLGAGIGAIAGAGSALLTSGAYLAVAYDVVPRPLTAAEFAEVADPRPPLDHGGLHMRSFVGPDEHADDLEAIGKPHEQVLNVVNDRGERTAADVVTVHGMGRYVVPWTLRGYLHPMLAQEFAGYLRAHQPELANPGDGPVVPLKLLVCHAALPPGRSSVAQTLATALGRTVYAGRGFVYVTGAQNWVRFTP
jgi:hypothetical protein